MSCRREAAIPLLLPLAILEDCTGRPQAAAAVTAAHGCLEESASQWLLVTKLRTQRERLNSTMFLFYYLLVRSSYLTGSWEGNNVCRASLWARCTACQPPDLKARCFNLSGAVLWQAVRASHKISHTNDPPHTEKPPICHQAFKASGT